MKITEAFLQEHHQFYDQLDRLERAAKTDGSLAAIQSQVAPLVATLMPHARLEDELLFAELEPQLGPVGPLSVMRMEHDEIDETLASLQATEDPATAKHLVLHVVDVARQHFLKEEQVLFPMAEQVLSADTLERLGNVWAERQTT